MDKTRKTAVKAVIRLHKGGWTNLTAKAILADGVFSARDKAFAAAIFYGTAERIVTLDFLLQPYLKKPITKMDVEVRSILETGLYQIKYMNVPASAAVNEAVSLARSFGKSSAAGLVNAVLRKAKDAELENLVFASELEKIMAYASVSEPVAKAVMQACPNDYEDFFAASFSKQEMCIRTNTLKIDTPSLKEKLEEQGFTAEFGQVQDSLFVKMMGGVIDEPLFKQGFYHVQGEASQLACACVDVKAGQKVLDVCAAPGGKSATLAERMGGGKGLIACDARENRVPLIEETFARLGIKDAEIMQNDGTQFSEKLNDQDRILCDVPCSGLGVLASKPDIRYNSGDNFDELPLLQLKILETSARYVKKGGKIVYSTCTIRPQENEQVVQKFLRENKEFALISPDFVPQNATIKNKMITTFPQNGFSDGFFVATMERL